MGRGESRRSGCVRTGRGGLRHGKARRSRRRKARWVKVCLGGPGPAG